MHFIIWITNFWWVFIWSVSAKIWLAFVLSINLRNYFIYYIYISNHTHFLLWGLLTISGEPNREIVHVIFFSILDFALLRSSVFFLYKHVFNYSHLLNHVLWWFSALYWIGKLRQRRQFHSNEKYKKLNKYITWDRRHVYSNSWLNFGINELI